MNFKHAIVRKPGKSFHNGLTTSNLGKPDYDKTILQHSEYTNALRKVGLELIELEADEKFPDSTFVEDTAIVNEEVAVISNLGAPSRQGEEQEIKRILEKQYNTIEMINSPGTLEGGDVLRVENQYYIGLSKRTNREGARELTNILKNHGYTCSTVPLINFLHLKSGISYVGDNTLIIAGEFKDNHIFKSYNRIKVEKNEMYAANSIMINDYILIPKGYDILLKALSNLGYKTLEIDTSEFKKMDGGLSCLSIRF